MEVIQNIINIISDNIFVKILGIITLIIPVIIFSGKMVRYFMVKNISKRDIFIQTLKYGIVRIQIIDRREVYKLSYDSNGIEVLPNKVISNIRFSIFMIFIIFAKSLTSYEKIVIQSPSKSNVHCHDCSSCKSLPDIYITSKSDKKMIKINIL